MFVYALSQPGAESFLSKKFAVRIAGLRQSIGVHQRTIAVVERENFLGVCYVGQNAKRQSVGRDCLEIAGRTGDKQRTMTRVRDHKMALTKIRKHKLRSDEHVYAGKLLKQQPVHPCQDFGRRTSPLCVRMEQRMK